MNKKFLAIAVAAALAPAAASADVKLYGIAQVEYNIEDSDASGQDSVQSVDDDGVRSRIGVKFTEKLGGGLTAFGKFEWALDPADDQDSASSGNTQGLRGRDQFVGIKGSWGSLSAGAHHAPYKTAGGVKWDPWTATHLQARRAGGMLGGTGIGGQNGFMRNSIYYTSPEVNGFQFKFAISPDETNPGANNGDVGNSDDGDNDYSIAVHYTNGPWEAIFAHNRNNQATRRSTSVINVATTTTVGTTVITGTFPITVTATSNVDDETLTKVGLRWKSGPWTLAGQYETVDDALAAAGGTTPGVAGNYRPGVGDDADVYWLNGQYKAGNNIFSLSYGNMDVDPDGTARDFEYDYWAVGVIHKFSKQTRIFGGYTQTDGDKNGNANDRDAWTVGIRKDF
ncbi:porin [Sulfuriflexus mobilis]|uniref:porin n=1 Tax=Sulfuriflexus mobilis TaxID=1811807 RepID=UPI000F83BCCB|nr:porin [Sulfuriflexus mobilis]